MKLGRLNLFLAASLLASSVWAQSMVNQMSTSTKIGSESTDAVGEYRQPEWTTQRSFSNSRTYLIPHESVEAEFWVVAKTDRETHDTEYLFQQEIEYGFARHWQFDFYVNQIQQPSDNLKYEGVQIELRYAFGDWNQIFLNPTLYLEYHPKNVGTDAAEVRLLLAQDVTPQWRFSSNLAYEVELFNEETREYAITAGMARAMNASLALGLEAKTEFTDTKDNRWHMTNENYVGPSIQWKPTTQSHIDLAVLGGLNDDSHSSEAFLILGMDL